MTLSELRRLEAAATNGPWEPQYAEATNVRAKTHGGIVCTIGHLRGRFGDAGRIDGNEAEANAAIIAAMRNQIGALLDIAEAAQNLRDVKGRHHSEIAARRLFDALARLEGK